MNHPYENFVTEVGKGVKNPISYGCHLWTIPNINYFKKWLFCLMLDRYLSVETRQELLRIENSWNAAIVTSVIKLGVCWIIFYFFHLNATSFVLFSILIFFFIFLSFKAQNVCCIISRPFWWINIRLASWLFTTRKRNRAKCCQLAVQILTITRK